MTIAKSLKRWWWREINLETPIRDWKLPIQFKKLFVSHMQRKLLRAAWYYEAENRLAGKYRFNVPFSRLSLKKIYKAFSLWGEGVDDNIDLIVPDLPPKDKVVKVIESLKKNKSAPTPKELRLLEDYISPLPNSGAWYGVQVSFNLESSNTALHGALEGFLIAERKRRGMKEPGRGPRKGKNPRKNEPFTQIEEWDKATDGENYHAKKKSEVLSKYFEHTRQGTYPPEIERRLQFQLEAEVLQKSLNVHPAKIDSAQRKLILKKKKELERLGQWGSRGVKRKDIASISFMF